MSIGRHTAGLDPQDSPQAASHAASHAEPSAEAVLAWTAARDAVLRGLVHALSNRVGTVAAVGGMLGDGAPASSIATAGRVLAGEGERLERLLALFRLATADPFGADAAAEPLAAGDVLGDAAALAGYGAVEDAPVGVAPGTPPLFAGRAGLLHALVTLAPGGRVHLDAASAAGGSGVAVRVTGVAPDAARMAAAAWLVRGGAVRAVGPGAVEVVLPALGGR